MSQQSDMEVTEERARKIENVLKDLYEDQYGCELVRVTEKKDGASALDARTGEYAAAYSKSITTREGSKIIR